MDPAASRSRCAKVLQGNADPCLLYASKETIKNVATQMVQEFGTRKYIANLGHGMLPDHDPEHLRAYLEAVKEASIDVAKAEAEANK
jgi:uroporphyrinogen decarboxylase